MSGCDGIAEGGLIPSVSIANLLQQRDAIIERVEAARSLLVEADVIAGQAGVRTATDALIHMAYNRETLTTSPAKVVAAIDANWWSVLLAQTGLESFMDAKARKEWQEQISNHKTPPLTRDNIEATFTALYDSREAMFERGVVELFRQLSWNYKTNLPARFGRKLIIERLLCSGFMSHPATNTLDDLTRAFCILDRVPEPDHRSAMWQTLQGCKGAKEREWVGPFFQLKWFKNGNGHVAFLRPDLVDKMNAVLAKHYPGALPAGGRK